MDCQLSEEATTVFLVHFYFKHGKLGPCKLTKPGNNDAFKAIVKSAMVEYTQHKRQVSASETLDIKTKLAEMQGDANSVKGLKARKAAQEANEAKRAKRVVPLD